MSPRVPLQEAAELDFEKCVQHVDRLKALKNSDAEAYEKEIKELGEITRGLLARTSGRVSAEMAESILSELEEFTHMLRPEVAKVLREHPDPEFSKKANRFMGSSKFVPLEEAVEKGILPEDYR